MSKSDPIVEVEERDRTGKVWRKLGKTEKIMNNLNPDFSTPIECDFFFERE